MPVRAGDFLIMARNTSPANAAPRRTEPREGQAAWRPDQQQPYPHQGFQPAPGAPGYPPAHHEAPQGHGGYGGNQQAPGQQPPPYGHPAEAYAEQGRQAPTRQSYVPTQTPYYIPQFEPYQPPSASSQQSPPAPFQGADQGWDQPPPQHQPPQHPPLPQQQWQHADPAEAYQQAAPRTVSQRVEPSNYDTAAYGHGDGQYAGDAYQSPRAASHLRGPAYDQTPHYDHAQGGWSAPPAVDESYAPQAVQEPAWGAHQGYADPHAYGQQAYGEGDYAAVPPRHGYGEHGYGEHGYGEHGAAYPDQAGAPDAFPPEPGFGPAEGAYAPPLRQRADGYSDEDYDSDELAYEDEQASGRSRWLKIAAIAAVGVVIIGSGVYGYTKFVGPSQSSDPPLVRKAEAPAKIKPDDPGGKQFAHTDSKILGRLSDGSAQPASDSAAESENGGARKVSTMVIGRDGSIVASPDTDRPPPSRLPQAVSPVPGMTIVDGFGGRNPRVSAQPSPSAPAMVNAPAANVAAPAPADTAPRQTEAAAPTKPVVIARTEPTTASIEPADPPAAASAPSPAPSKKVTRTAPAMQKASAPASSGAGYVAVLASIPRSGSSRMDALKQFADLQQKYAGQLGGKTPDVQEANLGEKGNYHRLVVGPPGSRQEASRLCSQLKSAGYSSCWIKSY